ncbi:MAG: hypothetical protein KF795_31555 [Labilithrix sp.]|nr:hypothetical protein [Labilithrix sp.]
MARLSQAANASAVVAASVLVLVLGPLAAPTGCGTSDDAVRASIVARFSAPRGVLDKAKQLELRVLDGAITCDEATGAVAFPEGDASARQIAKTNLGQDGCPPNVKFCGNVSIEKSATPRVFEAAARDGANLLAVGCTTATIELDAVPVSIKMFRFLAPAVCGDGTVQPTEQCEPGGTSVCDEECQSTEILLSVGASGNKTSTGKAGDKTDAFFLWPQGSGNGGRFLAFFSDRVVPSGGGTLEVGLRVMSDDLTPAASPPALANGSIFLPNGGVFPPDATARQQSLPAAALLGGKYYVVFQDDVGASLDIHLRVVDNLFQADGPTPLGINGGDQGEPGIQTAPAIAAGTDRVFIAWQDQAAGTIVGRTLNAALTLGSQNQISTGNGNARPAVAATSKGWVTVWKSDTGIKLRAVDANGTPSGGEQTVNEGGGGAEGGRVASLPDGRFAVVWSKGGDVFVQRYDERAIPIAGDQATPVNDVVTEGDQTEPTIAATPAAGGSYVVAWHDTASGHIRARFLGGSSGFLFNNVNGQTTEFQASRDDGRNRAAPVAAVGGSGPFVAIGWEDKSSSNAGIVARRFPLPSD